MIVRHIKQTYQYTISYLKAWRAKQRVFEMRFGTYEASYDNLPGRNPGSFYDTYLVPAVSRGQSILQRAFFCLGACVRAFQCCLPVICIDGTFLTGRYKGQILTAIGVDCNNQISRDGTGATDTGLHRLVYVSYFDFYIHYEIYERTLTSTFFA